MDDFDALDAGMAYAFYRHGQDRQTEALARALNQQNQQVDVHLHLDEDDDAQPFEMTDLSDAVSWDDYVGQEPLKRQLLVRMLSAQRQGKRMPHTLLASGMPGVGKTTMARIIAATMKGDMIELMPPFNIETLVDACESLLDGDFLFIDEIHKLADNGKAKAEQMLLKLLEDGVLFYKGQAIVLNDFTVLGATTDKDALPEPVLDRFIVKPYFQPYTQSELIRIAMSFAFRHDADKFISDSLAVDIATASRGTPRVVEQFVLAAKDMTLAYEKVPTAADLLVFLEVTEDGLTRTHVQYLTSLLQFFGRENKDGNREFIAGEAAMQQLLRETKQGIGRVERFLIERGLIDRTPRGRRLTHRGINRAREFVAQGKGASHVA